MMRIFQEKLQMFKTDKEYRKDFFLIILMLALFFGFLLVAAICSNPTRLITKYLHDNYQYNQEKIELVSLGHNTYKLINPPVDPVTNIVLENWKIDSWGGTYSAAFNSFAIPLDLPKEEYQTVSWSMDFTDEEYQILSDKAEQEQLSVQEYITRKIMELISSGEMSTK